MAAQPPHRGDDDVAGLLSRIPSWVALAVALISGPASVGIVSRSNETQMALYGRELEVLQERINDLSRTVSAVSSALSARPSMTEVIEFKEQIARIEQALDDRITRAERIELLTGIEKTDQDQTRRLDRLQELIYRHRDEMLERTTSMYAPQGRGSRLPPDTAGRERCTNGC